MIALYLENLKKMKNLKIYNEKAFRDLGSGFVVKQKGFFCDQRSEGET